MHGRRTVYRAASGLCARSAIISINSAAEIWVTCFGGCGGQFMAHPCYATDSQRLRRKTNEYWERRLECRTCPESGPSDHWDQITKRYLVHLRAPVLLQRTDTEEDFIQNGRRRRPRSTSWLAGGQTDRVDANVSWQRNEQSRFRRYFEVSTDWETWS